MHCSTRCERGSEQIITRSHSFYYNGTHRFILNCFADIHGVIPLSKQRSPKSEGESGPVSFPFSGIVRNGVDTLRASELTAEINAI
jgi:hypothetical protein